MNHEPMVDEQDFDAVDALLETEQRAREQKLTMVSDVVHRLSVIARAHAIGGCPPGFDIVDLVVWCRACTNTVGCLHKEHPHERGEITWL